MDLENDSLLRFSSLFLSFSQSLKHFLSCPNTDDSLAIEMAIETVSISV